MPFSLALSQASHHGSAVPSPTNESFHPETSTDLPRSRTTSMLSSMRLPSFGRLSLGGWTSAREAPAGDQNEVAFPKKELSRKKSTKGVAKDVEMEGMALGSRFRRSISVRRLSTPSTSTRPRRPSPPPPTKRRLTPLGELDGTSDMSNYLVRSETFSRSPPELHGHDHSHQPWLPLHLEDGIGAHTSEENSTPRASAAPLGYGSHLDLASSAFLGPRKISSSTTRSEIPHDDLFDQDAEQDSRSTSPSSNSSHRSKSSPFNTPPRRPVARSPHATYTPPVFPPDLLSSSPPNEDRRQAAHAEALARLTADSSALPPRPTRSPPPPPFALGQAKPGQTRWSVEREWLVQGRRGASSEEDEGGKGGGRSPSRRTEFKRVVHSPSPSPTRSRSHWKNDVDLVDSQHSDSAPSPLPIEINLRGRVVRVRQNAGLYSLEGSTSSSASPFGSEFSFGRRSLEVPSSMSSSSPSVTFLERIKASDREKDWGAPSGNVGNNKVYGDRRMAESAIDVLAVVEEDDSPIKRGRKLSVRQGSISPTAAPRRAKRLSFETPPSTDATGTSGAPRPRPRHSSDLSRPSRLSTRSFSSSSTEQTARERDEFGPIKVSSHLLSRNQAQVALGVASSIPFPSPPTENDDRANSRLLPPIVTRPREHKRWNSELFIDQPLSANSDSEEHPGPRHKSLAATAQEVEDRSPRAQRAARTKLVLKENGRPALTYQLGECIGKGQFGAVYRALNLNSGRVVAVKRISLEGKTEEEVAQLSHEVGLLKSLAHPSVVKYEGLVRSEHYLNIILEFVENGSLQKTLKNFGELPEALVASYVVKILESLDFLHSRQVVHCDLKAANILTTKNGNIKVSDFGVSLNLNALNQTREYEVNGTPNWMAPEVIELKGASTASDIWSLGCTILELIDGKPPYSDLVSMSAMFRIVEDDCPPIPSRCSPELVDFLQQCFRKDPADRPSANDLFAHEWLQMNWDPQTNFQAQDSVPFLRRISTEMRRPELAFLDSASRGRGSPCFDDPFLSPSDDVRLPFSQSGPRDSFESTHRGEPDTQMETEAAEEPRAHAFVKTTFSKAVECRLCGDDTKRHAVLCSTCGLIAHSRCAEMAPSCLEKDQMFTRRNLSTSNLAKLPRSPLARYLSVPSSSIPAPTPPLGGFSFGDILPFKSRRPKVTPTSSTTSVPVVPTSTPSSPSPSKSANALRHISGLLVGTGHSPSSTPPGSVSRNTRPTMHHDEDVVSSAQSSPARRDPSLEHKHGLSRKLSVAQTSDGTKLRRQKSHSRTMSQPVNQTKMSEDCLLQ